MKPFRFALQPLRAVREHKEQSMREYYARALSAREDAAALVQTALTELAGGWTRLREQVTAGASSADLQQSRAWCDILDTRVKERTAALAQARQAVEAARQDLMLATRDRETLERFYEQRRRAHNHEAQREEQKRLDEIALQLVHSSSPLRPDTHAAAV